MVDFDIVPHRTALINVDMQNYFVEGSPIAAPDGLAVLEGINRLATACRRAGILVIHTIYVLRADGSNLGVLAEIDPIVKTGILNKGSEAAALHSKLVVGRAGHPSRQAAVRCISWYRSGIDFALTWHRHADHQRDRDQRLLRDHGEGGGRPRFPRVVLERWDRNLQHWRTFGG
jgi:hypothetical protein